jgi:hypothetical protein
MADLSELPKTVRQAIERKRRQGKRDEKHVWRFSEARNAYYVPLRYQSREEKARADKYDIAMCSAGANAQMAALADASPRASCGSRGMGATRSQRLRNYWGQMLRGVPGALRKFKENPANVIEDGNLVYVWRRNPESGKPTEWGVIEPRSSNVLITGTSDSPESGLRAAHQKAHEAMVGGGTVKPRATKKTSSRGGRGGKQGQKNPSAALRNLMRGT